MGLLHTVMEAGDVNNRLHDRKVISGRNNNEFINVVPLGHIVLMENMLSLTKLSEA